MAISAVGARGAAPLGLRRLMATLWMSLVMQGMSWVLLPLLVLSLSGPGWAGVSWFVAVFPYVLLGVPAGRLGDRFNRRTIMIGSMACSLLAALVVLLQQLTDGGPALLMLAALLLGASRPFTDAASFGLLGAGQGARLRLSLAVAGEPGGRLLGALLSAACLGVQGGEMAATVLTALGLSAVLLSCTLPRLASPSARAPLSLPQLFSERGLRRVVLSGLIWNVLVAAVLGGLAGVLVRQMTGWSMAGAAVLVAAGAAAALVGALLAPGVAERLGPLAAMWSGAVGAGLLLSGWTAAYLFGLPAWAGAPLFVLMLLCTQIFITNLVVERQQLAPEASRSIVATSSRMVTWLGLSLGTLVYSAMLGVTGVRPVLLVSCCGSLAVIILMFLWWRSELLALGRP